jgi:hypothetical protein
MTTYDVAAICPGMEHKSQALHFAEPAIASIREDTDRRTVLKTAPLWIPSGRPIFATCSNLRISQRSPWFIRTVSRGFARW